ncbi:MAG: response regulator transcription factor [Bacteroidetes bacterium]|nr:response regulator transcription factor [Bacteroidota bacterium]
MKVLIADDHKIVRLGLSLIIKEEFPQASIFQAGNAADVYTRMRDEKFDLMLMDLKMPDTDSLQMLEQVLLLDPHIKILIISLNPERIFAIRYLKAGAYGYVEKSEDDTLIRAAIHKVAEGKKYMSEDVIELMTEYIKNGNTSNPFGQLAKREFDVAMHLANGLTSSEICVIMDLKPPTISTYKTRIFDKLNIKTVHELMEMAKENRII